MGSVRCQSPQRGQPGVAVGSGAYLVLESAVGPAKFRSWQRGPRGGKAGTKMVKVKSPVDRSSPVKNLLPHFVRSIINYFQ